MSTSVILTASQPAVKCRAILRQHFDEKCWVDGQALYQLDQLAQSQVITSISAFPDLHVGKYGPVGIAFNARHPLPRVIGNDIGCGMSFFALDLKAHRIKLDKTAEKLRQLETFEAMDTSKRLEEIGLTSDLFSASLGSIGGGNHFCELQIIEETITHSSLEPGLVYLLVHSGSRGYGQMIIDSFENQFGKDPFSIDAANTYQQSHDKAVAWASLNRRMVAERVAELLKADVKPICDVPHNIIEQTNQGWLHRKGAARATGSLLPIAGSRDSLSYIVAPGAHVASSHFSVSHGAGRKYDRQSMTGRGVDGDKSRHTMSRNPWGGRIICEDKRLLNEEKGAAYKDIEMVIEQLRQRQLVVPIAAMRPLVTFKRAKLDNYDGVKTLRGRNK